MNHRSSLFLALASSLCFSGCIGQSTDTLTVGKASWIVLKCMYSDTTDQTPAGADDTIEKLFNGKEGVKEWFTSVSHNAYQPTFDIKTSWKTMSVSLAQDKAQGFTRQQRTEYCAQAWGVNASDYDGLVALLNVPIDSGFEGNVLLDPGAWNVSFATHEMGHRLGLNHSFDTSDRKDATWSQPGEYFDPWDIMSAMNVFGFSNSEGLEAGPDMALPFKLQLGWLASPDVAFYDARDNHVFTTGLNVIDLTLRPYESLSGADPLGACVDLGDLNATTFTRYCVEYRLKKGWSRAIPNAGVLVHFQKNADPGEHMTIAVDQALAAPASYTSPDDRLSVIVRSMDDSGAQVMLRY